MLDLAKTILDRVGVVTDQLLAGSIVGSFVIAGMGTALASNERLEDHGVVFYYIAAGLILIGFSFYTFARFFSVSSEQELAFREQGKSVVEDHRKKTGRS